MGNEASIAKPVPHVGRVLELVLAAENFRGGDYHDRAHWRFAVKALMDYSPNLRLEKDRKAIENYCAQRHATVLWSLGYGVDITAKIHEPESKGNPE